MIIVDEAISNLTAGKFVPTETTEAYQEILEQQLHRYGRPLALYVDIHRIFRVNQEQRRETLWQGPSSSKDRADLMPTAHMENS